MNVKTNKSGFTLTEILIVLVIAGILLAVILPNATKAIARGNSTAAAATIKSCNAAVVACYAETNPRTWVSCKDNAGLLAAGTITAAFPSTVTFSGGANADDPVSCN